MSNPVWPLYGRQNVQAANAERSSNGLGKDDFLKILVAQMSNQDPTQPLQDRDFIAQMAQFSSVEQLVNMSGELTRLRQSIGISEDLIGKQVTWTASVGGSETLLSGIVTALSFKEGMQYAEVGEWQVALDELLRIEEAEANSP